MAVGAGGFVGLQAEPAAEIVNVLKAGLGSSFSDGTALAEGSFGAKQSFGSAPLLQGTSGLLLQPSVQVIALQPGFSCQFSRSPRDGVRLFEQPFNPTGDGTGNGTGRVDGGRTESKGKQAEGESFGFKLIDPIAGMAEGSQGVEPFSESAESGGVELSRGGRNGAGRLKVDHEAEGRAESGTEKTVSGSCGKEGPTALGDFEILLVPRLNAVAGQVKDPLVVAMLMIGDLGVVWQMSMNFQPKEVGFGGAKIEFGEEKGPEVSHEE